jgi:zinc transport system ATP-binding protein
MRSKAEWVESGTEDATVLAYEDVCFAYEREEVLHNVNLHIHAGSLVAIVGPNGGGKSTLLRLALGLIRPFRGEVRVLRERPERSRRRVGYVPQQLLFDPAFPVNTLDVVLMGRAERHLAGPYRRSDRRAAMEALERVNLADQARRGFADLSGGERQRVLIAQSLVSDPSLLLLDEPTANVDPTVESRIYDLLKELNERITIVVVSHNLNVVTRHASHLVCVNRTASILPMEELTQEKLQAIRQGDMTVLHHEHSCHVIDPSEAMRVPHRASHTSSGEPP